MYTRLVYIDTVGHAFNKRPFVNFKRYRCFLSREVLFSGNLLISKISGRRPNHVRPFCFPFANIF
jgi:hypothetical protein